MNADSSVLVHYLQPIQRLLEPADVTELVINRPGEVGVEGPGGWRWHELPDLTPAWLATLANAAAAFTRQDVNAEMPMLVRMNAANALNEFISLPHFACNTHADLSKDILGLCS